MRGPVKKLTVLKATLAVALALMLGACDADSPTAPDQTPNQPAGSTAATNFSISVSLSPRSVVIGDGQTVTVTVVARRSDNNQFVPQGSTALLSTTSGVVTNSSGTAGNSVAVAFGANGTAQASVTGATATATIRAQIQQSQGQATLTVSEAPTVAPLSVQALVPNFGLPAGGTAVRIEGTGFSAPAEVRFGGVNAQIRSISENVITVLSPSADVPSGQNLVVSVAVEVNIGEENQGTDTVTNGYTYTRNLTPTIPKIISVTPTSGPNEGGTQVTIFGEAFGSEVQVYFGAGSRVEAVVNDVSPTRILATTPSATGQNGGNRNSTVAVEVVDLRSGFVATMNNAFQYGSGDMFISSAGPTRGIYFGGDLVTVFGQGFEGPIAIEFGGLAQQPVSVSGTEVVARSVAAEIVNCSRPSGPFQITNIETSETITSGLTFTYEPVEPVVFSINPGSATANVDTGAVLLVPPETEITGLGFDAPKVTFGTVDSSSVRITSFDPVYAEFGVGDEMIVRIPPYFPLPFPEIACQAGGAAGVRYVEARVDVVVTNQNTDCTVTLSNGFGYIPADTSCRIPPAP